MSSNLEMMKKRNVIFLIPALIAFISCEKKPAYLSTLNAGKNYPLYTTYAAAQERSDFILDEGYQFCYDADSSGADFITDTGGDICLGFRKNGQWVYRIADMYKPPVIKASYPDMVEYGYEPFPGIRVSALFLTYSSRTALLEFTVTNQGDEKATIDVCPFMRSNKHSFHSIELDKGNRLVAFSHEEYPDGWTISHNIPYVDSIADLFMFSSAADETFAFTSESGESAIMPSGLFLSKEPLHQLTGRLYSPQGERLAGQSPENRLQLTVDGNEDVMITENSSVWGTTRSALETDGYFYMEAGNINTSAKKYRLTGYNEKVGKQVSVSGSFSKESERCDLKLTESGIPVINKLRLEDNRLEWEKPDGAVTFSVYRRAYPEVVYLRIVKGISDSYFQDTEVKQGQVYGYVVTCSSGSLSGIHSPEVTNLQQNDFSQYLKNGIAPARIPENARILSFMKKIELAAGSSEKLRIVRSVSAKAEKQDSVLAQTENILKMDITPLVKADEQFLSKVKTFNFKDEKQEALFWSNVNMMRQVFYPPQGKSGYNYYVFSREPSWGWGHGGQVFHESITMLAYADVDPVGAMNSQRVYSQRQYPNGYINYRTGAFLDEIIENDGELTSSAPWYSWLNWEVYKMTRDRDYLKEMYESSAKFYNFYTSNRDKDGDGLCEWGGHAILESVRDALVAVWDEVGWPANFEGPDLNSMLVMEAKSLEAMARELGLNEDAEKWKTDYQKRTGLINKYCWDEETGFYYNVDMKTHSFTFKNKNDLKRMEIIGFLPLWAGVATNEQAKSLVANLTDPSKFWRQYGVPSLAADDKYYNDKGYWNGPVWIQWNYLIERGLLDYGYKQEAAEIVSRVTDVMYGRLQNDHNLWEFYSPDNLWGGHHKTYIWAGILNRMMKEANNPELPR